jgi:acetyl-CoA C-acetyltransferase
MYPGPRHLFAVGTAAGRKHMPTEAFVFDAIRTPRGSGGDGGALHGVKPVSLVVGLIDELRRRHPLLDPATIDDVLLGITTPVGDQGGDLARIAALVAGLPTTVAGAQVNRLCASGLEAVNLAAMKIRSGWGRMAIAGGVESMSRVPMASDGSASMTDPETSLATGFVPQGIAADLLATITCLTRNDVDAYAATSQLRAATAWQEGRFARSVVPVRDRNGLMICDRDERLRPRTTRESLSGLAPAFAKIGREGGFDAVALQRYHWLERIDHVHTSGNSSGAVDGAGLVLVGSEAAGEAAGLAPRARITAAAVSGTEPTIMLTGPAPAARAALDQACLTVDDLDLVEINEAFAAVPLHFMRDLGIDADRVNVNGGTIAMGHPLGAAGAILLGTLLDELERRDLRRGLVTLCAGCGMGIATILERP